jgi:hypothetical protein
VRGRSCFSLALLLDLLVAAKIPRPPLPMVVADIDLHGVD